MAIPEEKSVSVDEFLTKLNGKDRTTTILKNECGTCETPNMNFREEIDRREYSISGMCQTCQDSTFADPEDEDDGFSFEVGIEPGGAL